MKTLYSFVIALFFSGISIAQTTLNMSQLGHVTFAGQTCAGVWHYVDSLGNEYALVGASNGLAIVDVTTPLTASVVQTIPVNSSLWQEIKVWNDHIYHVTEGGGGVTIVNLNALPGICPYKTYNGDGLIDTLIGAVHTVAAIDDYLYLFGTSGIASGGVVICDISDPWNPTYVSEYTLNYVHDGYISGNTMYTSEIYAGQFAVVDITNKSTPTLLATQSTPSLFNHNSWLSDDGLTLFTTDEVADAPLASYDISDLSNIKLLDTYLTELTPSGEVHNVRVLNDYLFNADYAGQVTIVDADDPENLIEVARFPTNSWLCWDVDPFLPSGNILAADVNNGLFILGATYQRAAYLQGTVTDSLSGIPLGGVDVMIMGTPKIDISKSNGTYKTGYGVAGTYDVQFSKSGYATKLISGVSLVNSQITNLNVELVGTVGVEQDLSSSSLEHSVFPNPSNGAFSFNFDGLEKLNGETALLELYSVTGELLFSRSYVLSEKIDIDVSNFVKGIYFYKWWKDKTQLADGKLLLD